MSYHFEFKVYTIYVLFSTNICPHTIVRVMDIIYVQTEKTEESIFLFVGLPD